jgi:hypothetical protein
VLNPNSGVETDLTGYFEFMVSPGTYEFGTNYVGFDKLNEVVST